MSSPCPAMVEAHVFALDGQGLPCATGRAHVFLEDGGRTAALVDSMHLLVPPGTHLYRVAVDTGDWIASVPLMPPASFPRGGAFVLRRCYWKKPP